MITGYFCDTIAEKNAKQAGHGGKTKTALNTRKTRNTINARNARDTKKYSLCEGGLSCSMGGAETLRCHTAGDERLLFYPPDDDRREDAHHPL